MQTTPIWDSIFDDVPLWIKRFEAKGWKVANAVKKEWHIPSRYMHNDFILTLETVKALELKIDWK